MYCKSCYANHIRRDGGHLGLCWQHKKTKCRLCGELSDGKHYCVGCERKIGDLQIKHESSPLFFDSDHDYQELRLKRERLTEARHTLHRAVDVAFKSFALTLEALVADNLDSEKSTLRKIA